MASVRGMRTGGKNRKSPGLHVLQATFRKQRHEPATLAAHAPAGLPEPPQGLPEAVLAHWHVTVAFLQAMGTASRVDALIVEQYCRLYVETAELAVAQAETGASIARLEENLSDLGRRRAGAVLPGDREAPAARGAVWHADPTGAHVTAAVPHRITADTREPYTRPRRAGGDRSAVDDLEESEVSGCPRTAVSLNLGGAPGRRRIASGRA